MVVGIPISVVNAVVQQFRVTAAVNLRETRKGDADVR
jgi:hypothetical protein